MSDSIRDFFGNDHHRCDGLWSETEAAAESGAKDLALVKWSAFRDAMRHHFAMEEEVLFPAFEDRTGMHGVGPTAVMRMEHAQMKQVLEQMDGAAQAGDLQSLSDLGDTLLMLIQQHNVKEEGMLYPMADQALASERPALFERLAAFG